MSAAPALIPVSLSCGSFLLEVYASTRAAEMSLVPWTDDQKQAFLQMQSDAQDAHYRARYPAAFFNIVTLNDDKIGRFYFVELDDEFRIIDLTILPEFYKIEIYTELVGQVLRKGDSAGKFVRIYLENSSRDEEVYAALGFRKTDEHGIYFLWQRQPEVSRAITKTSAITA